MSRRYNLGEQVIFLLGANGTNHVGTVVQETAKGVRIKTNIQGQEMLLFVRFDRIVRDIPVHKRIDVDNMIQLTDLSALTILENLKQRYLNSKIYTYIGNIVLTVNPYKDLLIDGPEVMVHYFNRPISTVAPHLYGLAETVYQAAVHGDNDQVVVISGESGSGKTEAFKRITRYLAAASESRGTALSSIAKRVLESTPLLESFGNATTLRNDNSSRFGKYVEIFFADSIFIGAKTTNFLLETCRIVRQGPKERNYHVFYEILSSLDDTTKQVHHLGNVEDYSYLGTKVTYTSHSDLDGLSVLLEAWHTLGLPREEINLCLRVISAILHLGNLKFKETYDGDKCTVTNPKVAEIAASELGVDPQQLTKVITMKLTQTMRESLWSPVRESQAVVNRDSIAKQIYSELFDRLVAMLNDRLSPPDMSEILTTKRGVHTVALLDIYGFENLPYNSLEQLCINYTNENLQQFFNHYIFELEQQEYVSEGIDWQFITFPDNQPIIHLIAGRPNGIFLICNDEASLAAGTDRSFLQRCQQEHRDHPNFLVPKLSPDDSFAVVHFAGEITYNIAGFVDKNREQMRSEVLNLLIESTEPVVASMFQNVYSRRSNLAVPGPRLKTPMVLATFNTSLQNLMEKMKKYQPQFVRCIKPNMEKKPMTFEDAIVFDQLRYTGVLEATRIRKSGFPVRPNYKAFIQNYGFLLPKTEHQYLRKLHNPMEAARYLLNRLNLGIGINGAPMKGIDFELGKTKLFMRNQLAANLDAVVSLVQARSARIIQNAWRRRGDGLYERARENACKVIQSYYRGYRARRQNPSVSNYVSNRVEDLETKEPPKPLNDLEIARLDLPGDLVYILEERDDDQSRWLQSHRVSKPRASVRRLLQGHQVDGWQSYGRPVWDAQPLSFILRGGKSKTNIGYTLAPLQRPLLLAHATEPQRAACVAASKLHRREKRRVRKKFQRTELSKGTEVVSQQSHKIILYAPLNTQKNFCHNLVVYPSKRVRFAAETIDLN
ncbi:hypothetical protein CRM22_000293 [Opisthorchis felineus]|uniref:Myosin motor domain-containing protein n=2 Tax=Opisthorchis felineus TaxID=147828 RepID=A0A4S2MFP1_OPIFE|nr:hypothetical protein CRM22_000293 [Opisthorchis felineus]